MARSAKNKKIETRTNRLALPVRDDPYYTKIGDSLSLGYRRKKKGNGTWQARIGTYPEYRKFKLAEADDFIDANENTILTFYQAQEKARAFADQFSLGTPRQTDIGSLSSTNKSQRNGIDHQAPIGMGIQWIVLQPWWEISVRYH